MTLFTGVSDAKTQETWEALEMPCYVQRAGLFCETKQFIIQRLSSTFLGQLCELLKLRGCMLPSSLEADTWHCEKCGKAKPSSQVNTRGIGIILKSRHNCVF